MQFLDIMNILVGATSPDFFLKAYKTSKTKEIFPYEWFDSPEKLAYLAFPPYNELFSRLRNWNPLDEAYSDYQNFLNAGYSSEEALKNSEFLQFLPEDKRIMHIYSKYGKTRHAIIQKFSMVQ